MKVSTHQREALGALKLKYGLSIQKFSWPKNLGSFATHGTSKMAPGLHCPGWPRRGQLGGCRRK